MIRAVVVDDEPLARSLIRELLAGEPDVELVAECGNGKEALAAVRRHRPDLLFLDVQMPGMSGTEVAAGLHGGPVPYVIFVTAHDRYAIEAFRKEALDYLLKPFSKERFGETLQRARRSIRDRDLAGLGEKLSALARAYADGAAEGPESAGYATSLRVRSGRILTSLDVADVAYFQAASQYVKAHTRSGSHLLSRSLASLENALDPQRFCRIHRSTLVNKAFVREVRLEKGGVCTVLMAGGERLRLSRRRRAALDELLRRR